jgi:hypothetical protein
MAFLGTTPIGGPVMGAIGEHAGARVALAVAGLAAVGSAAWATWANRQAEVETAATGNVFDIDPAMDSLE